MAIEIQEILTHFKEDITECLGSQEVSFDAIAPYEHATAGDLTFVSDERFLIKALAGPAKVLIIKPDMKVDAATSNKTLLISRSPQLAMAKIAKKYFEPALIETVVTPFVHPTAIVPKSVVLGSHVYIGAHTVLGENVVLGDSVYIGPQVIIEDQVEIKDHAEVYPQCFIGKFTHVGKNCTIQPQCVVGALDYNYIKSPGCKGESASVNKAYVVLCDRVDLGSQCTISKGLKGITMIKEGTKLDNHCQISAGVSIGKNCLLTAGAYIQRNSSLGDFCITAGNTTVYENIKIADQVQLAGMSVVTEDILVAGGYGGYPLAPMKEYFKRLAVLKQLPKLRKAWSQKNSN